MWVTERPRVILSLHQVSRAPSGRSAATSCSIRGTLPPPTLPNPQSKAGIEMVRTLWPSLINKNGSARFGAQDPFPLPKGSLSSEDENGTLHGVGASTKWSEAFEGTIVDHAWLDLRKRKLLSVTNVEGGSNDHRLIPWSSWGEMCQPCSRSEAYLPIRQREIEEQLRPQH